MDSYLRGTFMLGAMFPWQPQPGDQYLVVHVKNAADVVRKQKGAAGSTFYSVAPAAVTGEVYKKIIDELQKGFREKGVDADLQILSQPPQGETPRRDLTTGVALGVGAVGIGWLLWRYVLQGLFSRAHHG
jgi:hypothetical protein